MRWSKASNEIRDNPDGTLGRMNLGLAFAMMSTVAYDPQPMVHTYKSGAAFCSIADSRITESSGLAASNQFPGTYYTHNDSGDTARFFRFDASGKVLTENKLVGASAVDWEAMATAKLRGKNYVFLGDIGDNAGKRKFIVVYRCEESTREEIKDFDRYEITYPDGPRDAETLMVHPKSGDIWIVSKVASGKSRVYWLAAPNKSGSYVMKFIGEVRVGDPIPFGERATDGSISHDGKWVAIRTYTCITEFKVDGDFSKWFQTSGKRIAAPLMAQGESVAYSLKKDALLLSSEGNPCPVSILKLGPPTATSGAKQALKTILNRS